MRFLVKLSNSQLCVLSLTYCFGAVFVVLFARDARGLACSGLLLAGIRSRLVDDPAAHNREQILRVQDFGFGHFHDVG